MENPTLVIKYKYRLSCECADCALWLRKFHQQLKKHYCTSKSIFLWVSKIHQRKDILRQCLAMAKYVFIYGLFTYYGSQKEGDVSPIR